MCEGPRAVAEAGERVDVIALVHPTQELSARVFPGAELKEEVAGLGQLIDTAFL